VSSRQQREGPVGVRDGLGMHVVPVSSGHLAACLRTGSCGLSGEALGCPVSYYVW